MQIKISSRKFFKWLITGIVILVGLHLATQTAKFVLGRDNLFGLVNLFNLDREYNVPSLYSFLLLFTAARLFGGIAYAAHTQGQRFARHWLGLAIIFAWLSMDEMLALHELWSESLHSYFHTSGVLYYIWQLPYVILLVGLLIFYYPFWQSLPRLFRRQAMIAAAFYLFAVFGVETLEGWYVFSSQDETSLGYMLMATVEETCEMLGVSVLIYALMEYARLEIKQVQLVWE